MMSVMSSIISVILGGGWYLTLPIEGDECEGEDKDGVYIIDEDGKCVLDYCNPGYVKSGQKCMYDDTVEDETGYMPPGSVTDEAEGSGEDIWATDTYITESEAPAPTPTPASPEKITTLPTTDFEAALMGPNGKYASIDGGNKRHVLFKDTGLNKSENTFLFKRISSGQYTLRNPDKLDMTCGRWRTGSGSFGCSKDHGFPFSLEERPGGKFAIKYGSVYIQSGESGYMSYSTKSQTPGANTDFTLIKI